MEGLHKLGIHLPAVGVYIVNFGVIFFLMARYIYKPLIQVVDGRRAQIRQNLAEAEALRLDFAAQKERIQAETEQSLAAIKEEAWRFSEKAQADALALVAEAEAQKDAIIKEASERIHKMETEIMKRVEAEAVSRVARAVELILRHGVSEAEIQASVKKVWEETL